VYEVNPRWTAAGRRNARRPGKSDALDAQAVARLVQREAATLPCVGADDESAVLAFLVAERAAVVAESTRLRNQLHQLLLQADPEYRAHLPTLRTPAGVAALAQYTTPSSRPLDEERAAAVRRLAQRLRLALEQADTLAAQIRQRAQARFFPLTGLCGVSLLTAGALAGILGPGQRFKTDAQLAASPKARRAAKPSAPSSASLCGRSGAFGSNV